MNSVNFQDWEPVVLKNKTKEQKTQQNTQNQPGFKEYIRLVEDDIPAAKEEIKEESKIVFDLTNETKELEVKQPVHFVPVTELNETGIIRHSLEEYMELENELLSSNLLKLKWQSQWQRN